jgi:predicted DNA-binding protein YlxM (UPF0122 family)
MDMKEVVRIGLLMALYENLLTERQRDIMHQYINEDFSLNEISELTGVTRQAAHDTVKKSIHRLERFEKALGLIKHNDELRQKLKNIKEKLNDAGVRIADKELDELISEI